MDGFSALVHQLEREAHQLEQDGDDVRSIRMMERALAQRIAARMPNSISACERLVVKYNTVAVRCFRNDDFEAAQTLLNSALELTAEGSVVFMESETTRVKLRGTTYNNYGCLERRRGNTAAAASYLKLSIEHAGHDSPASFLNLSAVLTQLGRYTDAVAWCRRAISILENSSSSSSGGVAGLGGQQNDSPGLMAIAYHNLASPLEQVDRAAAIAAYRKALEIARAEIGVNSSTTKSIQTSLDRFLRMAPQQVAAGGGAPRAGADPLEAAAAAVSSVKTARSGGALPAVSNFLPPVNTSAAAASQQQQHQNQMSSQFANTPRGRAMAIAAARKKGGSAAMTPRPLKQSPRRLTPLRDETPPPRRGAPRHAATATREEQDAQERQREEREVHRQTVRDERRRAAEADQAARKAEAAEKKQRVHSRTPPPAATRGRLLPEQPKPTASSSATTKTASVSHSARRPSSREERRLQQQELQHLQAPKPPREPKPTRSRTNSTSAAPDAEDDKKSPRRRGAGGKQSHAGGEGGLSRRPSSATGASSTSAAGKHEQGDGKATASSRQSGGSAALATTGNRDRIFSRAPVGGSGNPVKDLEEEISKKDDIVSFMVARLAALLRAEEDFERCYIAVCRIQCLFRKVRSRTRVAALRHERWLATTYRRVRESSAARCVVRFFRKLVAKRQDMVLAELREQEMRDVRNRMASKIQRAARMWLARRELRRKRADALRHARALRVLQCWFRKLLAIRKLGRLRQAKRAAEQAKLYIERRTFAATQIQRVFLGRRDALKIHRLRRSMRMVREKEMESRRTGSSKRIQAVFRGYLGRCVARRLRADKVALLVKIERWQMVQRAVVKLQAWGRGTVARMTAGPQLAEFRERARAAREAVFHNAATKINSLVRGFLSRRVVWRAVAARKAERSRQWGIVLLPSLQAFTRARVSAARAARRLLAQLEYRAHYRGLLAAQRGDLAAEEQGAREEDVASIETEARRQLAMAEMKSRLAAEAAAAKRNEVERVRRQELAAAEERRLAEIRELASRGPVMQTVRRPGKVSDELRPDDKYRSLVFGEIEEDEHDRMMVARMASSPAAATGAAPLSPNSGNSNNSSKTPRGPFYADREEAAARASVVSAANRNNGNRNISIAAREELRRQELAQRTRKRQEEEQRADEERRHVLAAAAGIRAGINEAIQRTSAVLQEPMPSKDAPVTQNRAEFEKELLRHREQEQKQKTMARDGSNSATVLLQAAVLNPTVRRHEWEDFSLLDAYTAAHRDSVLNAITRRSVAVTQAALRQRQSARVADTKACTRLARLPELRRSAVVVGAFLRAVAAGSALRRMESIAHLSLQNELHSKQTTRNSVRVIQAATKCAVSRRSVKLLGLSRLQERHVAASIVQAAVRSRQSHAQRRKNLSREKAWRADGNGAAISAEQDFAARQIQRFVRSRAAASVRSARGVLQQHRQRANVARGERDVQAAVQCRQHAVRILQRFFRTTIGRLREAKQRSAQIARRRQLLVEPAEDRERLHAAYMIQTAARIYLLRIRRRAALARRSAPAAAVQLSAEREYAAVRIQSVARGAAARRRRAELEREKARKWAGLLDSELEQQKQQQQQSPTPPKQFVSAPAAAPAAASRPRPVAVVFAEEEEAAAAVRIQSAFRGANARAEADRLRDQKKADWERIAAAEQKLDME